MPRSIDSLQSKHINININGKLLFNFSLCFKYLPDQDCVMKTTIYTVLNDHFHLVDDNMSTLGFSTKHKHAIYMILSAILNLGNIQFDTLTNGESVYITIDSRKFLCNAAALLKLNETELEDILICHTREVGKLQIK